MSLFMLIYLKCQFVFSVIAVTSIGYWVWKDNKGHVDYHYEAIMASFVALVLSFVIQFLLVVGVYALTWFFFDWSYK